MRDILILLLRFAAVCMLLYVTIGLGIAAFYTIIIDPNSACDISNVMGLVLTWPLFVAMALIFWFAAAHG